MKDFTLYSLLRICGIFSLLFLVGCATQREVTPKGYPKNWRTFDASNIPDATPQQETRSKYGNPASYVVFGKRYYVMDDGTDHLERGLASWYGTDFHERRTSSGEPYDMFAMTAAHKTLPIPSYVRVTNLKNGKTIIVKVNDRGPFHENRIIDLSFAAAKKLDMDGSGTAHVEIETLISPTTVKPKTAQNTSKPTNSSHSEKLFLQIGAYSKLSVANTIVSKLKSLTHYPINIVNQKTDEKSLYKVQIGPIKNKAISETLIQKIKQTGLETAPVIK